MDSVPRIVKSMVPSGIKKELRRIQDKSYSKTSASDVFTIGTNLLFSLPTSVDEFCITDKKEEYDIPFSSKRTRFNLQIDKIAYHNIKSGTYQIKVKKGNSYLGINTSEKGTLLTGTLHDISFSIMVKNSQLYLEILNSKDSNLYLLNKKTEILPFITVKVDYVNKKFVGIVSERKIQLKNVFFENGLGEKVTVKFWKSKQDIIFEWQSLFQNKIMSNENVFFLMGTVIEDNSEHQIIFKFEGKNRKIITTESSEFDHEFVNRIILHNNFLAFSHSTKEIAPLKLSKKLMINNNQIIFTLASEDMHKIVSAVVL